MGMAALDMGRERQLESERLRQEREAEERQRKRFEGMIQAEENASRLYDAAERIVLRHRRMIEEIRRRGGDVGGLEDGAGRMSGDLAEKKFGELMTELNDIGQTIRTRYFEAISNAPVQARPDRGLTTRETGGEGKDDERNATETVERAAPAAAAQVPTAAQPADEVAGRQPATTHAPQYAQPALTIESEAGFENPPVIAPVPMLQPAPRDAPLTDGMIDERRNSAQELKGIRVRTRDGAEGNIDGVDKVGRIMIRGEGPGFDEKGLKAVEPDESGALTLVKPDEEARKRLQASSHSDDKKAGPGDEFELVGCAMCGKMYRRLKRR
jgi:hypothetical protein